MNQLKNELIRNQLQHEIQIQVLQKKMNLLTKQCSEYRAKLAELKRKGQEDAKEKKSLANRIKKIEQNVNLHS